MTTNVILLQDKLLKCAVTGHWLAIILSASNNGFCEFYEKSTLKCIMLKIKVSLFLSRYLIGHWRMSLYDKWNEVYSHHEDTFYSLAKIKPMWYLAWYVHYPILLV